MGETEWKSEIIAIPNKYKNTLNNLINSSNIEFLDWPNSLDLPGLIDKRLHNMFKFRGSLPTSLVGNYLDEDILVTLLELVSKIWKF